MLKQMSQSATLLSQWRLRARGGAFDHRARRSKEEVKMRKITAKARSQEMCGNKVSTCHGCEMLLEASRGSQLDRQWVEETFPTVCVPTSGTNVLMELRVYGFGKL